jgi:hypothetical protein
MNVAGALTETLLFNGVACSCNVACKTQATERDGQ